MCGIWGISGSTSTSTLDDKFLKTCMIAGTVRGMDATGVIFHERDKKTTYMKKSVNGATFCEQHYNPEWETGNKIHSVIGHNRAATVGSINDDTAHPFVEAHIVGVHNGTLHAGWRHELEVSQKCDVDSRGLFRAIAAKGIDWAIAHLYGAAALVWTDTRQQRTFVYRNSERPLHYAVRHGTVYYASEAGMLEWAMRRVKMVGKIEVEAFKVNTLYEITGGKVKELRNIPRAISSFSQGSQAHYTTAGTSNPTKPRVRASSQQQGTKSNVSALPTPSTTSTTHSQTSKTKPSGTTLLGKQASTNLHSQNGVPFAGFDVSEQEKQRKVIGEFAERGFDKYDCHVCNRTMYQPDFYEEDKNPDFKFHKSCYHTYRSMYSATNELIAINRDSSLRPHHSEWQNVPSVNPIIKETAA